MPNKVIIDANALIALLLSEDSLHSQAQQIFNEINHSEKLLNPLTLSEVATIILFKTKNQDYTNQVIRAISNHDFLDLKIDGYSKKFAILTAQIFMDQKKVKLSFADSSIIAQAKLHKTKHIFSFDADLKQEFRSEFTFLPQN